MPSVPGNRTIQIFAGHPVFYDRVLPVLKVGDVISVFLYLNSSPDLSFPGAREYRVRAHPVAGRSPFIVEGGTLVWPYTVHGDGWSAQWIHDEPVFGSTSVSGFLGVDIGRPTPAHPGQVTGRITALRPVDRDTDVEGSAPRGPGSAHLRDGGRPCSRYRVPQFSLVVRSPEEIGVLIDLDLDDVPNLSGRFHPGSVDVHGTDAWVIHDSAPVLLHIDLARSPEQVTEYVLPVPFEPAGETFVRRVYAHPEGCWIAGPDLLVAVTTGRQEEVTARSFAVDTGTFPRLVDGRIFAVSPDEPRLTHDPRHGLVRVEPREHPVQELIDGRFVPVVDERTIALAHSRLQPPYTARTPDGTVSTLRSEVRRTRADGTEHVVDTSGRHRGRVHWERRDPYADPAIAELVRRIPSYPPVPDQPGDGGQ